jgi:hypothetical protein
MDSKDGIGSMKYFDGFHWFVVQTKPRDESRAETHLLNQKLKPFFLCLKYINTLVERWFKRLKLSFQTTSLQDWI